MKESAESCSFPLQQMDRLLCVCVHIYSTFRTVRACTYLIPGNEYGYQRRHMYRTGDYHHLNRE